MRRGYALRFGFTPARPQLFLIFPPTNSPLKALACAVFFLSTGDSKFRYESTIINVKSQFLQCNVLKEKST
ncbi:MAG: hypothetical protein CMM60_13255 [Rhodospirillaceae bacterium]|nr:hypothetical protein [Rhodospirillaceae bacterium]